MYCSRFYRSSIQTIYANRLFSISRNWNWFVCICVMRAPSVRSHKIMCSIQVFKYVLQTAQNCLCVLEKAVTSKPSVSSALYLAKSHLIQCCCLEFYKRKFIPTHSINNPAISSYIWFYTDVWSEYHQNDQFLHQRTHYDNMETHLSMAGKLVGFRLNVSFTANVRWSGGVIALCLCRKRHMHDHVFTLCDRVYATYLDTFDWSSEPIYLTIF